MPWSLGQNPVAVHPTVAGTTGTSLAFGSNVTAGQVTVAASLYAVGSAQTPTFSDTSANVPSWTATTFNDTTVGLNVAVAWGIAASTAACTPKVTWNLATSAVLELYVASFVTPGGAVSADGAGTHASSTASGNAATVILPAGGGSAGSDLLINMVGFGASWSSLGGSWLRMDGGSPTGDQCAYLLNAAGSSTPSSTQGSSSTWISVVVAIQAAAAATPIPDLIMAPAHR